MSYRNDQRPPAPIPFDEMIFRSASQIAQRLVGTTIEKKLLAFSMPEPMSGCWLWLGATNDNRIPYGRIWHEGRAQLAHRLSFECWNGPLAPGECALHRCDNSLCIGPEHLYAGSKKDNVTDCIVRGRRNERFGEDHHNAVLNTAQVLKIRGHLADGLRPMAVCRMMGIPRSQVRAAVVGWRHLA